MSRPEDLDRFYGIIAALREKCQGFRCLKECTRKSGWPGRGVYFFFEDHEFREDGSTLRVVRVGTHAVSANSERRSGIAYTHTEALRVAVGIIAVPFFARGLERRFCASEVILRRLPPHGE